MSKHIRKNAATKQWLHVCDCGKTGVAKKAGSWICQVCIDLERRYYGTNCTGKKLSIPHHHV